MKSFLTSGPGLLVIKPFSCSPQLSIKSEMLIMKIFLTLKLSVVFILLVNVKMPTIIDILTLMSRINFMLS